MDDDDLVAPDFGDQVGHAPKTTSTLDRLAARIVGMDMDMERPPLWGGLSLGADAECTPAHAPPADRFIKLYTTAPHNLL